MDLLYYTVTEYLLYSLVILHCTLLAARMHQMLWMCS